MARLRVEVRPGPGVRGYSLFVDGVPVAMGAGHRGEASCSGRCGDRSAHALLYTFNGAPGGTLSITLRCAAAVVCRLVSLTIPDAGPPWKAERISFVL